MRKIRYFSDTEYSAAYVASIRAVRDSKTLRKHIDQWAWLLSLSDARVAQRLLNHQYRLRQLLRCMRQARTGICKHANCIAIELVFPGLLLEIWNIANDYQVLEEVALMQLLRVRGKITDADAYEGYWDLPLPEDDD